MKSVYYFLPLLLFINTLNATTTISKSTSQNTVKTAQNSIDQSRQETSKDTLKFPINSQSSKHEFLPDRPLQLVRPDPRHHRMLEVVPENLRHLHRVQSGVAVVAVVGKFHSGKSFLLNQLMGKDDGFGIGPTVRPQTMGIWMWGKPLVINDTNDEISVIYLDTEGFAASNISEVYDAKIFAVATILSSYLIYNSVKIIDQGDIDYLDLLARRTRLFALRSQITKAKWFDEFNHDLLQFPPLVWVVQDFVQTTDEGETPQEWLHRIMATSSRESEGHNINLLSMFESVDCHTLFLPATKKVLLQDLSQAKESDLTEEYRKERDDLLKLIKSKLKPKVKNGKSITGPELASLLEILVSAANEGSLAEVPSRWNAFLEQMHFSSVEDCILFYESEISVLLKKYNHGAVNATELQLWHEECLEKSQNLLDKLLLGLLNTSLKAQDKLRKAAEEKFEKIQDINEKKIELRCSEVQRKVELKVEESLEQVIFPIKGSQLQVLLDKTREENVVSYKQQVQHLSDHVSFERHLKHLQTGIDRIFNGIHLKNSQAMEVILKAAITKAVETFLREAQNIHSIPRTTSGMQTVIESAEKVSRETFDTESLMTREEDIYNIYLGYYKNEISKAASKVEEDNYNLVRQSCEDKSKELIQVFSSNTDPKKLSFPVNETYLETRLKEEKDVAIQSYSETQESFQDMSPFIEVKREISDKIDKVSSQRRDENYKAYIKEVETPLKIAKRLIKLSSDKYDTAYAFQQYMEQVCLLHLDEGKASTWSRSLKNSIVVRYIASQSDLQDILDSKRGLWSSFKGLLQWLYSFIDVIINGSEVST